MQCNVAAGVNEGNTPIQITFQPFDKCGLNFEYNKNATQFFEFLSQKQLGVAWLGYKIQFAFKCNRN